MPTLSAAAIGVLLLSVAIGASAQAGLGGAAGQSMASPITALDGEWLIESVSLDLVGSTGDAQADQTLREGALRALGVQAGDTLDAASFWLAVQRLQALAGVVSATCTPVPGLGTVRLQCRVDVQAARHSTAPTVWPILHESPDGMAKLIVNGGLGVYSDGNPYFRNWQAFNGASPLAAGPDPGRRATFAETYIEPGVGGILRVAPGLYAYGSATVVASGTWGQDIFQRDDHIHVALEKAYAGLLWAPQKGSSVNTSVGRQTYTLNDGFLVHHVKGSTNVGERRGLFIGARAAHDMAVLLHARHGKFGLKLFYLDPNEYEPLESNSTFAGANLRYDKGSGLVVDATHIANRRSDTRFATPQGTRVPRQGIGTTSLHVRWRNAFGQQGLLLEGELGHQSSRRADVSAWAGYASGGYRFRLAGLPSAVVLRYAQWSGDKPHTARYERWDPLLPAGSDEWMGGMIFSKYVANTNLRQWRVRYFAEPLKDFNFTLDWFRYRAMETSNLGANPLLSSLASRDLGDELMFTGRWTMGRHHYLQTVASINWPGQAIRSALPSSTKPWTSLQASLYWFF